MSRKVEDNAIRTNNDLVVAGSAADGHGVMSGYGCRGAIPLAKVNEMAARSGIESSWHLKPKSAEAQLSRAVRKIAGEHGLSAEPERARDRQAAEERQVITRYFLVSDSVTDRRPGQPFGNIELVVSLYADAPAPEFEPAEAPLALAIKNEYDALTAGSICQAADVSSWLNRIHRDLLGGVKYGVGWYIPRKTRTLAEQIVDVFCVQEGYGEHWMNPPIPVASSAQLSRGLAGGLCDEVDETLADLEDRRRKVRMTRGGHSVAGLFIAEDARADINSEAFAYTAKGERVDIGEDAATTFVVRFNRVGHRVASYADLLGPDLTRQCRDRICDALSELDAVLAGGVTTPSGEFRDMAAEQEVAELAKRQQAAAADVAMAELYADRNEWEPVTKAEIDARAADIIETSFAEVA